MALPLVASATFFFLLGVGLCFHSLPLVVGVLKGLAPPDVLVFLVFAPLIVFYLGSIAVLKISGR